MARVIACSACWPLTDGAAEFDIEASNVRELIRHMDERYPGLGELVAEKMMFAIDGEIHQNAWFSPIRPDSEVYVLPRIGGG